MPLFPAVLLDLGGVVYVGDAAIPGAVEAVARLRGAGVAVRFLTNTTRRPLRTLVADLAALGLAVEPDEVFTPAQAARGMLGDRVPHLLVHPDLREDFGEVSTGKAEAVVVGDAGEAFSYASLNAAYRALEEGAELIALAANRSFKDSDDALSLDAGPFVAALEYAGCKTAQVIGKPAAAFFAAALASLGVAAGEAAMVGDDADADVGGAMKAGLAGVLVRTGKYRRGDEGRLDPGPTHVAADLAAAADWLLG